MSSDREHTSGPEGSNAPAPEASDRRVYWRSNLRYLTILLSIWFAASYGAGILFVEELNAFTLPGTDFPLGFWFAQQGSIYVFVALIFVYVVLMNRLDRRFEVDEGDDDGTDSGRRAAREQPDARGRPA